MTLEVLQDKLQINTARRELDKKGASHVDQQDSRLKALLRRLGLVRDVVMGDMIKSWDVLATAEFIESHVSHSADVGDDNA
jgi:hypothetical protein